MDTLTPLIRAPIATAAVSRGARTTPAAAAAAAWRTLSFTAGDPLGPPMVTVRSIALSNSAAIDSFTGDTLATRRHRQPVASGR